MSGRWRRRKAPKRSNLLDKALAIDPEYPLALSLAGWCHAQRSVYNWADDIAESQAMARSLAERAAEMSGDDPIILAVLGAVHTFVRNHGTARVLLERAVALDPNAAWAWSRLGGWTFEKSALERLTVSTRWFSSYPFWVGYHPNLGWGQGCGSVASQPSSASHIFRQIPTRADLASSSEASNSAGASGVARAPPALRMIWDRFCPSTLHR